MTVFDNFFAYAQGKVFDTNGNQSNWTTVNWNWAYDGQCVSLIKAYLKYGGCGVKAYGNAIDYWTNRANNGILNICDVVTSPQNGDIVVSAGGDARYGHIFIYCNGQAFTQNCCNNPRATLYPLSYQGTIYGYLRPKFMIQDKYNVSQLQSELGMATFTHDNIIIRKDSPTGPDTGKRFNAGDVQKYTEKWVGNGHRYISWVEGSTRYFAAISNSESQGVEPWATFSEVEETPVNVPTSELEQEDGVATLTTDIGVNARRNGPNGEIVRTYQPGAQIRYYWKWVGNGHRYIVWQEGSDYIFLAVSGSEAQGVEPWATFAKPEEVEEPEENPGPSTGAGDTPTPEEPADDEWDLEEPDLEPVLLESGQGLTVHTALVDKSKYKYKCPYVMTPQYVTVHNAGTNGNPSAETLNKSMGSTDEQKSWHLSVDDQGAWQGIPLNRNAWHAGDGAKGEGNRNTIAIEICCDMYDSDGDGSYNDKSGSVDPRWEKARDNGALAAAILLNKYGWDISRLKKHQDWKMTDGKYKYCPHHILNDGWDDFVELVQTRLDMIQDQPEDPDQPEEGESIDGGLVNTLVKLLIKLVNKLLSIFK